VNPNHFLRPRYHPNLYAERRVEKEMISPTEWPEYGRTFRPPAGYATGINSTCRTTLRRPHPKGAGKYYVTSGKSRVRHLDFRH
jgi:hypothetical protein